jgi:cytochrome c-type biogenesis protein CcmH
MIAFTIVATAICLLVVALITRPLFTRNQSHTTVDRTRLNVSLLRDELAALERDRASGAVTEAEYTQARDELARRLLEETEAPAAPKSAPTAGRPKRTLIALVLIVPLGAGLLYAALGTPSAINAPPPQQQAAGTSSHPDVEAMVNGLAAKLAASPDNPQGWAMLGRSYTVLGRNAEAVAAYEKIGPTIEQNAAWLSEYADALAMKQGGNPVGQPEQLAQKALKVDPDNLLALMLAGYAAAVRTDFATAIPLAERALKQVPPGSEDERFLRDLIDKSRAQQGGGQAQVASAAQSTEEAKPAEKAPSSIAVNLDVAIKPALKAESAGKVLFVIARVPGERMPIAVVRRSAEELPARITIDDSSSLNPSRPLSSIPEIEVEARVSASGTPMQASGDLFATKQLTYGKTVSAKLEIDQKRP